MDTIAWIKKMNPPCIVRNFCYNQVPVRWEMNHCGIGLLILPARKLETAVFSLQTERKLDVEGTVVTISAERFYAGKDCEEE